MTKDSDLPQFLPLHLDLFEFSHRDVALTFILRGSGIEALPEWGGAPSSGHHGSTSCARTPSGLHPLQPCSLRPLDLGSLGPSPGYHHHALLLTQWPRRVAISAPAAAEPD